MPFPHNKEDIVFFLSIMNYLSKYSPLATGVRETLEKLVSTHEEWMLDQMYQELDKRNR